MLRIKKIKNANNFKPKISAAIINTTIQQNTKQNQPNTYKDQNKPKVTL